MEGARQTWSTSRGTRSATIEDFGEERAAIRSGEREELAWIGRSGAEKRGVRRKKKEGRHAVPLDPVWRLAKRKCGASPAPARVSRCRIAPSGGWRRIG